MTAGTFLGVWVLGVILSAIADRKWGLGKGGYAHRGDLKLSVCVSLFWPMTGFVFILSFVFDAFLSEFNQ